LGTYSESTFFAIVTILAIIVVIYCIYEHIQDRKYFNSGNNPFNKNRTYNKNLPTEALARWILMLTLQFLVFGLGWLFLMDKHLNKEKLIISLVIYVIVLCALAELINIFLNWLDKELQMRLFGMFVFLIGICIFIFGLYNILQFADAQARFDSMGKNIFTNIVKNVFESKLEDLKLQAIICLNLGLTFTLSGFRIHKKRIL
jgi:hypothetical protein